MKPKVHPIDTIRAKLTTCSDTRLQTFRNQIDARWNKLGESLGIDPSDIDLRQKIWEKSKLDPNVAKKYDKYTHQGFAWAFERGSRDRRLLERSQGTMHGRYI